jgi:hypothetical protein
MGLFIHLSINMKGISNRDWEKTWLQSLDIFTKFPLPLSRHSIETKFGVKRHIYTQNLILDEENEDECWYLEGDLLSKQSAETFTLHRHLDYYKNDYRHQGIFEGSVFYSSDEYHSSTNGINLWGDKTQGYPFHLAILAVGMMLENHFPDNCYIHGDIEQKQVEVMQQWLETVYQKSFEIPIIFDSQRLYKKLVVAYEGKEGLVERFDTLHEGSNVDKFKVLLQFVGKEKTWEHYAKSLNHYDSLGQWGANNILRTVLEATEDPYELVSFVEYAIQQRSTDRKAFEWKNILELLCKDYVFVNPIQRENIKLLTTQSDDMKTIDDVMGSVFMKMSGMPHISPLYISEEELLEIFALRDPKNGNIYLNIIEEYKTKLNKDLENAQELTEKIDEIMAEESDNESDSKHEVLDQYSPHEVYIIKQALQQQNNFGAYEQNMPVIRESLQNLMNKYPSLWGNKNNLELKKGIYQYSFENGFGVSENGWKVIDDLEDSDILKHLFILSVVDNNERSFSRWRKHIFETAETWAYFKDK